MIMTTIISAGIHHKILKYTFFIDQFQGQIYQNVNKTTNNKRSGVILCSIIFTFTLYQIFIFRFIKSDKIALLLILLFINFSYLNFFFYLSLKTKLLLKNDNISVCYRYLEHSNMIILICAWRVLWELATRPYIKLHDI